jgi:long-chain fatty acid transport protein
MSVPSRSIFPLRPLAPKRLAPFSALFVWLLLAVGPPAQSAFANPLDAYGFGARAIALGGAFTGLADDFSATYYNPAGLAQGDDLRLELGYLFSDPNLRFNGQDANVDLAKGLQGGLVLPGEVLGVKFGVGIGMFLLDDRVTRVRSLPQQQPRFVLFDNRVQRLFVAADIAVEPIDNLYIGGGVTFMSDSIAEVDITGSVSLSQADRTVLQAGLEASLETNRYVSFGALYAPDAPWSLGFVFRDEFFLRLHLVTDVRGQIVFDAIPEDPTVLVEDGQFLLVSDNANLYSPRQFVVGGSYDFGPLLVAADLGLYLWSNFPAPTAAIDISLDLGDIGFAVPPLDPIAPPEFHDVLVPRVGLESQVLDRDHLDLTVRGGYFFEDSPAPDQRGLTNYADSAKHGISAGLGLSLADLSEVFPKPLLLDVSFLYIHLSERRYDKADPADLVGDYRIDGGIFSFGAMLSVLL